MPFDGAMTTEAAQEHAETRIGPRPRTTAAVVLSTPVVGAALGLLLPTLTGWALSQVHEAVIEGRHLSLRDEGDVDLVRERVEGTVPALVQALRRHGRAARSSS